jgi:COP9 signalosome complex subunit 1
LFVGRSSVVLCVEALKAAVAIAKDGSDVQRYRSAVSDLRVAAPSDPDAKLDQAWIDKHERQNAAKTRELESQLKGYKNNLIKESTRVCWVS